MLEREIIIVNSYFRTAIGITPPLQILMNLYILIFQKIIALSISKNTIIHFYLIGCNRQLKCYYYSFIIK